MATRQSLTTASAARSTPATPKQETLPLAVRSNNHEVFYAGPKEAPTSRYIFDLGKDPKDPKKEHPLNLTGEVNGEKVDLEFDRLSKDGAQRFYVVSRETKKLLFAFFRNEKDLGNSPLTARDKLIKEGESADIDLSDL